MLRRKKLSYILLFLMLFVLCTTACGKKNKEEKATNTEASVVTEIPEPVVEETPEEVVEPEDTHEGEVRSTLTGLWVKEKVAKKRPVALMINNISFANPQSGIGNAAIMYEAVVEGGITRMMAIFEKVSGERLGSVRSARHYFVSFADEYDAIFAHYGHTKWATAKIKELKVDNLSGLEGVGATVYYRDNSIKAPHNAFASAKGIEAGIKEKGYERKRRKDDNNHFTFYEEDTDLKEGEEASQKVVLGFSGYTSPYFEYNAKKKVYERFQFDGPHVDAVTNKQLAFKNLIIQYVSYWTIDTKNGYQSMDIENSKGEGLYITNGKAVPITWDKNEAAHEMHYYDANGELLNINPGKTYIALFPENRLDKLVLK